MLFGQYVLIWFSLVASLVKDLPPMLETWVPSLGWEDLLEKGKAIHSSILAWRIPWTIHIVHGVVKSWTQLGNFFFFFLIIWLKCVLELLHYKVTLFPFEINKCFVESDFKTI